MKPHLKQHSKINKLVLARCGDKEMYNSLELAVKNQVWP